MVVHPLMGAQITQVVREVQAAAVLVAAIPTDHMLGTSLWQVRRTLVVAAALVRHMATHLVTQLDLSTTTVEMDAAVVQV